MYRLMLVSLCTGALTFAAPSAEDKKKVADRLTESAAVINEVMQGGESIPEDLIKKAHCAVVIPGMKKGAFLIGAKYGKGFVSCRGRQGRGWTAPGAIRIEGGSFGLQAGGSESDVIMMVMNQRGAEKLLTSKFTLGGDAAVAAGPVGRESSAMTDAHMRAEILTWSRSRGAFAGISLSGGTVREDLDDNEALYGTRLANKEIVGGGRKVPAEARGFLATLTKYSKAEAGSPAAKKATPAKSTTKAPPKQ